MYVAGAWRVCKQGHGVHVIKEKEEIDQPRLMNDF